MHFHEKSHCYLYRNMSGQKWRVIVFVIKYKCTMGKYAFEQFFVQLIMRWQTETLMQKRIYSNKNSVNYTLGLLGSY